MIVTYLHLLLHDAYIISGGFPHPKLGEGRLASIQTFLFVVKIIAVIGPALPKRSRISTLLVAAQRQFPYTPR
jgi:hypothetical protein